MRTFFLLVFAALLFAADIPSEAAPPEGRRQNVGGLAFFVEPRTPEQIFAFYTARGFPEAAARRVSQACLLTVAMRNESKDVVWLEPARWRFITVNGDAVPRIARKEWERVWRETDLPPAHQATFGWTQLPESRDLQPGEPVGGNIAIARTSRPFTLEAEFATGQDKTGRVIRVRVSDLDCPPSAEEGA